MKTLMEPRLTRAAFTLVELLITVVIISLLAVLLLGSGKYLISKALSASCLSNLRGLHTSIMDYAADNGGCLPYATDRVNANSSWGTVLIAGGYLSAIPKGNISWKQIKNPLFDPGSRSSRDDKTSLRGHYGINSDLVGSSQLPPKTTPAQTRIASIDNPSKKILLFCAGFYDLKLGNVTAPMATSNYLPGATINANVPWSEEYRVDAVEGRHGKTVHVLFLGGNVEAWRPDDLISNTDAWKK